MARFEITEDMILKILKRKYSCPIDFLKTKFDISAHALKEALKFFDCKMKNCKIAVIETATITSRPEVRDGCWSKLFKFTKGGRSEKTSEEKKESK